jgi:hypothetical protein
MRIGHVISLLAVATPSLGVAASSAIALTQPFVLHVGEQRRVGPQGVEVTLRSLSGDSGCLTPSDCSLMLFKGTLVLRVGEATQLQEVDATIEPDAPVDLDFEGYTIRLGEVRRNKRGQLGATFSVVEAEKPKPESGPAEISDEDSSAHAEIASPAPNATPTPNSAVRVSKRVTSKIGAETSPPLWIEYGMLSNAGWSISFHSALPLAKVEARLAGESNWTSARAYERDFVLAFAELADQVTIEVRATAADGHALGPYRIPFDALASIRKQDMQTLRDIPGAWAGFKDHWVYFGSLYGASCGLREVRYSINSETLDQRFPLPPCKLLHHGESPADDSDVLNLPEKPQLVAVQLVFYDGTVSQVVVHRHEEY